MRAHQAKGGGGEGQGRAQCGDGEKEGRRAMRTSGRTRTCWPLRYVCFSLSRLQLNSRLSTDFIIWLDATSTRGRRQARAAEKVRRRARTGKCEEAGRVSLFSPPCFQFYSEILSDFVIVRVGWWTITGATRQDARKSKPPPSPAEIAVAGGRCIDGGEQAGGSFQRQTKTGGHPRERAERGQGRGHAGTRHGVRRRTRGVVDTF